MTTRRQTTLRTICVRNFKSIYNSGAIHLDALNVLIGNNGSGKSSLLEALETQQLLVTHGLDAAMQRWRGIDHVRNKSRERQLHFSEAGALSRQSIEIKLNGRLTGQVFSCSTQITDRDDNNEILIEEEAARIGELSAERDSSGRSKLRKAGQVRGRNKLLSTGESILKALPIGEYIQNWQFLRLHSQLMGDPYPRTMIHGRTHLKPDGSNVAEYLHEIRKLDGGCFEGIIEAMRFVLPYSQDIQTAMTDEVQRMMYLQMTEETTRRQFKVPGWLLSTGTLRILGLLAVLRHPTPPPLVLIEEIENGLDPRTINLVVDELRTAIERGQSQFIITTHSPYLMDLIPLSNIILCERSAEDVTFRRPADDAEIRAWGEQFAPGQLYTMSRLAQGRSK